MSTDQTHISVVTDEALTVGLKSWSRGQKSQAASAICSGGVSAVIGSSDLDGLTLVSGGASGNQLSCSLPFEPERPMLVSICLASETGSWIYWAAHQHSRNPGTPKSPSDKAQHNCQNNCAECQVAQNPCLDRARSTQAYLAAPLSPVPSQCHLRVRLKPGPLVTFRS